MVDNGDPRVMRTRRRLVDAYRALLDENDGRRITVTSVAARAGVTRSSFYAHFTGTGDLAVTALGEFIETVIAFARDAVREGGSKREVNEHATLEMVRFIDRRRDEYGELLAHDADFLRAFEEAFARSALRSLLARAPVLGDPEVTARYAAAGTVSVISWWLRENIELTPEALAHELILAFPIDFSGPLDGVG